MDCGVLASPCGRASAIRPPMVRIRWRLPTPCPRRRRWCMVRLRFCHSAGCRFLPEAGEGDIGSSSSSSREKETGSGAEEKEREAIHRWVCTTTHPADERRGRLLANHRWRDSRQPSSTFDVGIAAASAVARAVAVWSTREFITAAGCTGAAGWTTDGGAVGGRADADSGTRLRAHRPRRVLALLPFGGEDCTLWLPPCDGPTVCSFLFSQPHASYPAPEPDTCERHTPAAQLPTTHWPLSGRRTDSSRTGHSTGWRTDSCSPAHAVARAPPVPPACPSGCAAAGRPCCDVRLAVAVCECAVLRARTSMRDPSSRIQSCSQQPELRARLPPLSGHDRPDRPPPAPAAARPPPPVDMHITVRHATGDPHARPLLSKLCARLIRTAHVPIWTGDMGHHLLCARCVTRPMPTALGASARGLAGGSRTEIGGRNA